MWLFRGMIHTTKSTNFSWTYYFFIIYKMASRAGWNGFAGRIWPAGRSLETPGLVHGVYKKLHILIGGQRAEQFGNHCSKHWHFEAYFGAGIYQNLEYQVILEKHIEAALGDNSTTLLPKIINYMKQLCLLTYCCRLVMNVTFRNNDSWLSSFHLFSAFQCHLTTPLCLQRLYSKLWNGIPKYIR